MSKIIDVLAFIIALILLPLVLLWAWAVSRFLEVDPYSGS